jgi:hypothetical protein
MRSNNLSQLEMEHLSNTYSCKLLADLEDKRLKFDKNYVYNIYHDPNPEEGTFKKWRSKAEIYEK